MGCGLVHPNVIDMAGLDSKKFSGFAFGMGIERMAKLSYEIEDMRSIFKRHKISISITMKVLYSNITKAIKAKPKIESLAMTLH